MSVDGIPEMTLLVSSDESSLSCSSDIDDDLGSGGRVDLLDRRSLSLMRLLSDGRRPAVVGVTPSTAGSSHVSSKSHT